MKQLLILIAIIATPFFIWLFAYDSYLDRGYEKIKIVVSDGKEFEVDEVSQHSRGLITWAKSGEVGVISNGSYKVIYRKKEPAR